MKVILLKDVKGTGKKNEVKEVNKESDNEAKEENKENENVAKEENKENENEAKEENKQNKGIRPDWSSIWFSAWN